MRTYDQWDFRNGYVDPETLVYGGENFVSSESILIGIGAPTLAQQGDFAKVAGLGIVQNFNLSQNKNVQQLFEIGARDTFLLPGRTFIQATIARILFNGRSLMAALYPPASEDNPVGSAHSAEDWDQAPGIAGLWLNLAATIFNKTTGVALLFHDSEDDPYGGVYLEGCMMQAHNLTLASGQTVVAENVALRISKIKPIAFQAPFLNEFMPTE